MFLSVSALSAFYNGQVGFVLEGRACRAGINGPESVQILGPDVGLKTLCIRPIWVGRGNLSTDPQTMQMWGKIYRCSTLEFEYNDIDIREKDGKVIIKSTTGQVFELCPVGHPDNINPRDLIELRT